MADSDLYEFDAPQYYFDLSAKNEPDDSYFDCGKGSGPYKLQTPLVQSSSSQPLRSSSRHNAASATPKRVLDGITPKRPASFKTPKREPVASRAPAKAPIIEDEGKENVPQNDSEKSGKKRKGSLGSKSEHSPSVGVRSSPRLAAIAKAVRRSNAARRSSLGCQSSSSSSGRNSSHESKSRRSTGNASRKSSSGVGSNLTGVSKQRTSKSSMPKVSGMRGLSKEEVSELENIATVKHKSGSNKNQGLGSRPGVTVPQEFHFATNSRLKKKPEDFVPNKKGPLKAVHHGPTKPQEFHFATDSRVKKRTHSEGDEDAALFPNTLRCGSTTQLDKELPKGPTIPQPFNLTETRKASNTEVNKFVSVAELNLKFHTRTPQRFRSKSTVEPEVPVQNNRHKVTIPVTPNFTTRARSRQTNYLTREEMEQKQFEEEQKHMFKAHPVNKKIFEPPAEVLQDQRKKSTVPEPFNITKSKKEETPFGSNLKEMCTNLGFSSSSLASLPWGGVPSNWKKTSTTVKPFSFDSRDKDKMQKKKEKIQKIIEDEKKQAEFHAQPMPLFEEGIQGVPQKKPQTPTRVKPFHLRSDEKGEIKREEMKRKLEEEERLERERRTFHAQSDVVVHQQPFLPEKSKKPLTEISGFTLNTEVRSEARADFELHQKMKEDELLAAKREREERAAKEEAEEVLRLRREAVHKANPVRHFKPVEVKPSENPLTVPVSPNFATKTRLRNRISNSSVNSTMDLSVNVSSATFTTE